MMEGFLMAGNKFEKYIKKLEFKDRDPSNYRQVATINGKEFDVDFNIKYGAYWAAGRMAEGTIEAHKHDYNQILFFLGADPDDMGELNADIELCMGEGEELEKLRVVNTSAVAIPAGLAHYPSTITTMKKRFLYMEISQSNQLKKEIVPMDKEAYNNTRPKVQCNYANHMTMAAFVRKSTMYGPHNMDDHGGSLAFINNPVQDPSIFEYLIMCENIKQAPYRFGWDPYNPHAHKRPEILIFIGTDLNDLNNLGGTAEIYLGKKSEMERYVIDSPTAVIIPGGLAHNPLTITNVDRPFLLTDVRPHGMEMKAGRM
jgi:hypothetical protein